MVEFNGGENRGFGQSRCYDGVKLIRNSNDLIASYFAVFLNILLCILADVVNVLIVVALRKESSLHPPSKLLFRCLVTTDLCVGLISQPLFVIHMISVVNKQWILCRFSESSAYISSAGLCGVSVFTLSAISMDRLLALLLKVRYRQGVTLGRARVVVLVIWIVSFANALLFLVDGRVYFVGSFTVILLAVGIATLCYFKIFLGLRYQKSRVEGHLHDGQPNRGTINIERYKKTVYSVLCVHLTVVACYLPYAMVTTVKMVNGETSSTFLCEAFAATLVYFNSSLNPLLYCWKIREVREAVKETINTACCVSI